MCNITMGFGVMGTIGHKPKIKVISTGGTIASADSETGKKPTHGVAELLRHVPYVSEHFSWKKRQLFGKGKDSTLIDYSDWKAIAKEAFDQLMHGNPVLILHGTDTMAYTGLRSLSCCKIRRASNYNRFYENLG